MEDRVFSYFNQFVAGNDAFQTEGSGSELLLATLQADSGISDFPLIKAVVALTVLIQGMCRTLYAIPNHQEQVIRVTELLLIRFTEQCTFRYEALLRREDLADVATPDFANFSDAGTLEVLSASWVENADLAEILRQCPWMSGAKTAEAFDSAEMNFLETELEMKMKGDRSFHKSELVCV